MGLNIKNERVCALAKEAAERFGMSQTSVIEEALRRMLTEAKRPTPQQKMDVVYRILGEIDAVLTDDDREAMRRDMEELYDDQGLPA